MTGFSRPGCDAGWTVSTATGRSPACQRNLIRGSVRRSCLAAEITALTAKHSGQRILPGADAVTFMALTACFDSVARDQKRYAAAMLADLLDPRGGSETVDA